jgi:hypothetical protein
MAEKLKHPQSPLSATFIAVNDLASLKFMSSLFPSHVIEIKVCDEI